MYASTQIFPLEGALVLLRFARVDHWVDQKITCRDPGSYVTI